jgi:hypothetical protein
VVDSNLFIFTVNIFQQFCSLIGEPICLFVNGPPSYFHRTFFIYALHEDIKDPLSSKFAGSVLSVYVNCDLTKDISHLPSFPAMLAQVRCLREDEHCWPSNHNLLGSRFGGRKVLQLRCRSLRYVLKHRAVHWPRQHWKRWISPWRYAIYLAVHSLTNTSRSSSRGPVLGTKRGGYLYVGTI